MLAGLLVLAQTLDQIIASLNPGYDPMRQSVKTQQAALPAQFDAQQQGLTAQADQAHQNILSQAQNRGLGFSGIPVGEQAKYDATTFMPAVANLKGNMITAQTNLSDQLNKINLDQQNQGNSILQTQQARDEQQRQFDQNMAFQREQADRAAKLQAQQSAALSGFGGGSAPSGPSGNPFGGTPQMKQSGSSFNFFDENGQPVTAAAYAQKMGVGFRDLLSKMASAGDQNAKLALNYVGNDAKFGGAPQQYAGALGALGATGSYAQQQQQAAAQNVARSVASPSILIGGGLPRMGGGR